MPRPIHFEIHVDEPQRAIDFYTKLFDWKFQKWDGGDVDYWMVVTGPDGTPGINGGMVKRKGTINGDSVTAYVCTLDVKDLDETVKSVLASGGQMALPKMPIPGMGWLAYCKDTEGNIFGMMQEDPTAK